MVSSLSEILVYNLINNAEFMNLSMPNLDFDKKKK